jgi:hypothetical protein
MHREPFQLVLLHTSALTNGMKKFPEAAIHSCMRQLREVPVYRVNPEPKIY